MNKGVEIEGEIDEEEPESLSNMHQPAIKEDDNSATKNIQTKPIFKNIIEMTDHFTNLSKEVHNSALKKADNLSLAQIKSFDILEKVQAGFYTKEMIEIQETFALIPLYMKKISDIREKMKEINIKVAFLQKKKKN